VITLTFVVRWSKFLEHRHGSDFFKLRAGSYRLLVDVNLRTNLASMPVKQYLHLQMYARNRFVHHNVALELNIPSYWAEQARRRKTTG